MLEFDGRAAALDPGPQAPVVLGLDVATSGEVGRKHREMVRDDEVVFFIRPWAGRHTARLTLAGKRVIGGTTRGKEADPTVPSAKLKPGTARGRRVDGGLPPFDQSDESSLAAAAPTRVFALGTDVLQRVVQRWPVAAA